MADSVILGLPKQVGFTVLAQRERLFDKVFPDFATIMTYSERDLKDMVWKSIPVLFMMAASGSLASGSNACLD
jgi:hypothetical protein